VNLRSVDCYRKFAAQCDVDVYTIFILLQPNAIQIAYSDIHDAYTNLPRKAWDGNEVVLFPYTNGLPHLEN
jgi:hypothetical protein